MTWHRTDDGFPKHRKSDALEDHFNGDWQHLALAFTVWHHMGCDCSARLSDGTFDARHAYRVIRAPRKAVDTALEGLVAVGFLERTGSGFQFHDWADYQPTKAEFDARSAAKAQRQARWRATRTGQFGSQDAHGDASTSASRDSHGVASTSASRDGAVAPAPSRPVPSRPVPYPEEELKDTRVEALDGSGAAAPLDGPSVIITERASEGVRRVDEVQKVFNHWQLATRKPGARLDSKRRRVIQAALRLHPSEELCRCIDGYASNPWHQGQNDRGRPFLELDLMLRDAAHIESGLEFAHPAAPTRTSTGRAAQSVAADPSRSTGGVVRSKHLDLRAMVSTKGAEAR
jgi:hypothetical protein